MEREKDIGFKRCPLKMRCHVYDCKKRYFGTVDSILKLQ